MHDFNPSGFLLPLAKLSVTSTAVVESIMEELALIYSKGDDARLVSGRHGKGCVDGSLAHLDSSLRANRKAKGAKQGTVTDSGYASAEEDESPDEDTDEGFAETLEIIRSDSFERELTIRWLTGFISRSSVWMDPVDVALSEEDMEEKEALIEKVASLLSSCAAVTEEENEALSRRFAFPLRSSDAVKTIRIELNDLVAPEDHNSVGLQSWASSIYFARLMAQDPGRFRLFPGSSQRILELGAGTGMLSVAAAKIIHALSGDKPPSLAKTEIIATDYHLDVLMNLQRNVDANVPPNVPPGIYPSVVIRPYDWQYPSWEPPFEAPFDLILAADVVYGPCHASWIKNCVSRLLKKPTLTCQGGVLWMIIALRNTGRHEGLADGVFEVFPISRTRPDGETENLSLKVVHVEDLEKCEGVGRRDEAGYRLLKIHWV